MSTGTFLKTSDVRMNKIDTVPAFMGMQVPWGRQEIRVGNGLVGVLVGKAQDAVGANRKQSSRRSVRIRGEFPKEIIPGSKEV